jgi:transcriptional regulator with XRE-family HTH domain
MARTHKDVLKKTLESPEVRAEYEALHAEYEVRRALLYLRREMNMTQREIAQRVGTQQEYVSRIERGHVDLSLTYLARLVDALDADLEISFRPRDGRTPIRTRITVA